MLTLNTATALRDYDPAWIATGTAGQAINAGTAPIAIAITPDGKTAYVASEGLVGHMGTVTPIRTATNTAGKAISAGSVPSAIAITPDGKTAGLQRPVSVP